MIFPFMVMKRLIESTGVEENYSVKLCIRMHKYVGHKYHVAPVPLPSVEGMEQESMLITAYPINMHR